MSATGRSTGAAASATAASSDAVPAQLHDSRQRVAESSSHGMTTARIRVVTLPEAMDPRSTGLSANPRANTARAAADSVSCADQIHAPSAASGMATTSMRTSACDGFQKVTEPSTASTQANGSAGTPSNGSGVVPEVTDGAQGRHAAAEETGLGDRPPGEADRDDRRHCEDGEPT